MFGKKIFYGWYIVAACFILIILDGLLLYSFGVFLPYINESFGFSRAVGSSIFSFRSLVLAFSLVLSGRLVDKYDPRIVVFSGGLITALGVFLSGVATEGWHLFLSFGFLVGLGDGVLYITCVTVISRWFTKKRSLAIGIITTGVPLSGLFTNPLTAWLIETFGVRQAFYVLAVLITFALLASFILKGYPKEKGLKPYGEEDGESQYRGEARKSNERGDWKALDAFKTPTFWLMYLMFFLGFTTFLIIVTQFYNFEIDLGIAAIAASGPPAAIGAGSIIGRITLSGFLTEVMDSRKVLLICFLFQGSSVLLLLGFENITAFYIFGFLFGFFYSGWVPIFPTLLGKFYGLSSLGTIYGFFGTSFSLAAIGGPLLAGYTHDVTGSYFYPFVTAIILCYLAVAISLLVKAPDGAAQES